MVPFSLLHLNHNQGDCPAPYSKCGMGPDQVNKARACPQMTMVTIILSIKDDDNDVDNDDNPLHDQGRTHCPHSLCLPLLPFPLHTCLWTRWFVIITIISSVQYRQSKGHASNPKNCSKMETRPSTAQYSASTLVDGCRFRHSEENPILKKVDNRPSFQVFCTTTSVSFNAQPA